MLGEIGSIASIVGVGISLGGLGFAIWQLLRLRGETRAAREASEETRTTVRRDLTMSDISRVWGRIQVLKEMHRTREWNRALDTYPEIQRGLIDIRNRYPGLSEDYSDQLGTGINRLGEMEYAVESANDDTSQETLTEFNQHLSDVQLTLTELEIRLQQSN